MDGSERRFQAFVLRHRALQHRRQRAAGQYRVYTNAFGGIVNRRAADETHDAGLRRAIFRAVGEADNRGGRCDVDDGAAARLQHGGDLIFVAQEQSAQIDSVAAVPLFQRHLVQQLAALGNARCIAGAVQAAVGGHRAVHHVLNAGLAGNIRLHKLRPATGFFDGGDRDCAAGSIQVSDGDIATDLAQQLRSGLSDATSTTGDDDGFTFHAAH